MHGWNGSSVYSVSSVFNKYFLCASAFFLLIRIVLPLGPINEKHSKTVSDFRVTTCFAPRTQKTGLVAPKRAVPVFRFSGCKITPSPTKKLPICSSTTASTTVVLHLIPLSLSYLSILPTNSMNLANFFWHKAL